MKSKDEELIRGKAKKYIMARRKRDVMDRIKHCKGVALKDRISNTANLDYIKEEMDSLEKDLRNT